MIPPKPTARFDASAVYILVGGLGGFGRGILEWMVARGARNLTIWSRSGKVPSEAEALLSNLRRRNINVSIVRCDITDKSSVDSAIRSAKGQSYPIRGIIHAAVTFCDQAFEILPYKQWNLGLSAKITGTENLHHATIEHNLDLEFFVMTSSYEAVVALPTQAAYCSANAFQDAFARYRRSIGLPACAIALGLITEIGDVGQRDITRTMIDRNNLYGTGELGTLRLLEAAFMDTPDPDMAAYHWQKFDPLAEAQITTCLEPYKLAEKLKKNGSITNPPRWLSDKKFSHIVQAVHDLSSSSEEPKQTNVTAPLLARAVDAALGAEKLHDAQELVLSALKDRIAYLLRIAVESIEATKSVAHYGVDSLIAVELRSWIVATFGSAIPLLKLLDESVPLRDIVGWIVFERKGGLEKL
jgi:NADP-dependent 3-hydroxy acid dehydrogenase YdfG